MKVKQRFILQNKERFYEQQVVFGLDGYSEFVYYKHYSRLKPDGTNETWSDTVIRVIEGVMSIRKDFYTKNGIEWCESYWQDFAYRMGTSMLRMEWTPPGRGLWAMGSDVVYERGSMPLYNCAATYIKGENWIDSLCWLMDCSMNGVGVGFCAVEDEHCLREPEPSIPLETTYYSIPDDREGWVESVKMLLWHWANGHSRPVFNYSLIRSKGVPIKTFGGIASGPDPLIQLHDRIWDICTMYNRGDISQTAFKTDLANMIGVCVVSGNVRRSAEIALGDPENSEFWTLKDYSKHTYRAAWGWMSNNSLRLSEDRHFEDMDMIAQANINGHDLGYLNLRNLPKGRLNGDVVREDKATLINPCGEIPLEDKEVCNLAETCPTRCIDIVAWFRACEYASFYCSTVALLPTHSVETNKMIAKNRRIGVSIVDFTGWVHELGVAKVTAALREGYEHVKRMNVRLAEEAGVPASIRVTTVKPGGTVPKLVGRTSGASHPTFTHTLRRTRVGKHTAIAKFMIDQGIKHEPEANDPENTWVFEHPIIQGPARPATEVSLWEQAMNIVLLQREWADNAVSNTLYFKPQWSLVDFVTKPSDIKFMCRQNNGNEYTQTGDGSCRRFRPTPYGWEVHDYDPNHEEFEIEPVLAAIAPLTKSVSLLPHSAKGAFAQMPEEGLSILEYQERKHDHVEIDWLQYQGGTDGEDEKFCTGAHCEV